MRITPWLAVLLVLFVAVSAGLPAQPQDTFIATTFPPNMSLCRFAADGTILGTLTLLPTGYKTASMAVAGDNQSLRLFGWMSTLPGNPGILLDVSPQGVVKTLHVGSPLVAPVQLVRTCDGDWLILNQAWSGSLEFYRYQGQSFSTVSSLGLFFPFSITENPESGLLLVDGQDDRTTLQQGYYRLDPWNGTLTSIYICPPRPAYTISSGPRHLIYDTQTGALFDMQVFHGPRTCNLVRVQQELGVTTLSQSLVRYPVDLMRPGGRATGFDFYLFAKDSWPPAGPTEIIRVKKDGTFVGKSLLQGSQNWWPGPGVLRTGSRHLAWYMDNRPNGRSLHLSFPGETGLNYAVGLSLTGIRPGIPLRDGRTIPLVPDNLTWLSLKGGVPGVLEHTVGNLDVSGRARMKVDTNAFGSALKGVKIWAVALILDPAAPAGVAHIAGPTLLTIRR